MTKISIYYHSNKVRPLEQHGDWIDLKTADPIKTKGNELVHVSLGISMALPKDYEAHILPRSSTFRKYGLLLGNSEGIIDNAYAGIKDIWVADFFATRAVTVPAGTRLLQFRLVKIQASDFPDGLIFDATHYPQSANRGGFGSTGD